MATSKSSSKLVIEFASDAKVHEFDPTVKHVFALTGPKDQTLVAAWDIDHTGYGFWRIKIIGVEDDAVVMKEFEPGKAHAAFYGSAAVIGAGQTELFSSFSYEDDDVTDEDGNIVNKVKELRVYPVRKD